ncbi:MAG: flippase-like domain-containing protein [Clostridia bacterium]|nr:flippase-like domain-containing protein [Clostridia bacterium]
MKNWKKWLSTALFVVMIALLGWYLYEKRADLAQLLTFSWQTVALILALALGACTMNAVYHKMILDTYGIDLSLIDWMGVVFVANAMALVLPMRADLLFTAAYYRRTKGFAYTKSASVAAGNVIFGVMFALLQLFAALLCTGLIEGQWPAVLWLLWFGMSAAVGVFLVIARWFENRMPAFLRRYKVVVKIVSGFNALLGNRKLLWKLLGCLTVNNILHLFLYMACFRGIGMQVTVYKALFYNSISRLMNLVAIVPGNIGIAQLVMGVSGSLMGDVFHNGVVVSLIQRISLVIIYIVVGGAFAIPVWKRWNKAEGLKN